MADLWEERKRALENEYFHRKEREQIARIKEAEQEEMSRRYSRNRCPKCGRMLQAKTFRGVPLDQCISCGGIWLGPRDLQILSEKDHRTWFEKWFQNEDE